MLGQVAPNAHAQRRLVAQHAGVGRTVQRSRVEACLGCAAALADERAPLFGKDFAGHDQLRLVAGPIDPARQTRIDGVLEERWVAEQDDLLEVWPKLLDDAQDL